MAAVNNGFRSSSPTLVPQAQSTGLRQTVTSDGKVSTYSPVVSEPEQGLEQKQLDQRNENTNDLKGYALVIIFASFLLNFAAFGYVTTWGVYQDYYTSSLPSVGNVFQFTWVGSIAVGAEFGFGLVGGPLLTIFGYKPVLWLGTILTSAGLLIASFGTKIWHFYLTQGLMFGIGASLIFMASSAIPPSWFNRNRALAMGIAAAGSGVGGLILGVVTRKLLDVLGIEWTLRVIALFEFVSGGVSSILLRPPRAGEGPKQVEAREKKISQADGVKNENSGVKNENTANAVNDEKGSEILVHKQSPEPKKHLNLQVFKERGFVLWLGGAALFTFGYLIPFSFIPSYATSLGYSASDGAVFISVMSAMNGLGRILIGIASDRLGSVNIAVICYALAGLSCLVIWQFAKTFAAIMGFSVVYGLFSSSYFTLVSPITVRVTGLHNLPSGLTFVFASNTIGALAGIPICGALFQLTGETSYIYVIIYTGLAHLVGAVFLLALKFTLAPKLAAIV